MINIAYNTAITNTKWKICIEEHFKNCEYIYPIQQRKVLEIINYLKDNSNVKRIIIFGSSVNEKCNINSDVDIYVELEKECKLINKSFNFVYDLWTNFTVDTKLLEEIMKTGVVVYEK